MRTSVEIPDSLLARARRVMRRKGLTLRDLMLAGLRRSLDDAERADKQFVLRDARWCGPVGFAPGVTADDLSRALRDMNEEWRRS